jgi:hypothetical protein
MVDGRWIDCKDTDYCKVRHAVKGSCDREEKAMSQFFSFAIMSFVRGFISYIT